MPEASPVDLFYSYSHADEKLRIALEKHLSILKRLGVLRDWNDRLISGGSVWEGEIDARLEQADIILLLVSPDFVASKYCWDVETTRALDRHESGDARVIPVILRPALWKKAPFGKLQALPKNAKPITKWSNRDEAFLNVAEGIEAVAAEISRKRGVRKRIRRIAVPRSPAFTGRESEIEQIRSRFERRQRLAVVGPAGTGKTQLAAEFCYRFGESYDLVWWIRAEDPATVAVDLFELAVELGLPEAKEQSRPDAIKAVGQYLAATKQWLIVGDNVRSWAEVKASLPVSPNGRLLVTSQVERWPRNVSVLRLGPLNREDARWLLLRRTGQTDEASADAVASLCADLPLALEQAAAYVETTGIGLADYAATLRQPEAVPESLDAEGPRATSELALDEIHNVLPAAAEFLRLAAFLAPEDIPLDLLVPHASALPPVIGTALADAAQLDEVLAALRRYSLIDIKGSDISVHRTLQSTTRELMGEDESKLWAKSAAEIIKLSFPFDSDDVRMWPECERLMPHGLEAALHAEELGVALIRAAGLLSQLGLYLKGRGDLDRAQELYQRALAIAEKELGAEDDLVGTIANNLGIVFSDRGQPREARKYIERALAIAEKLYDPDDASIGTYLSNLANTLLELNDVDNAELHYARALSIAEKTHGSEDPAVATVLVGMASARQRQGDAAGARLHLERAVAIDEKAYGATHPEVAIDLTNLGNVLQDLGDTDGAREAQQRALAICVETLGADHVTTKRVRTRLELLPK
jgi:tetratricopeptide (TPR) repeat protein